jgi:hypothetical protein
MKLMMGRSRLIMAYLLLIHLSALLLINLTGLGIGFEIFISLLIIVSLLYYSRLYGWIGQQNQITVLWVDDDGFWFMADKMGSQQGPMQLTSSVLLGPVIAIYFKPLSGLLGKSVLIPEDAVKPDDWRRLRVRLRDPESWD